jgi:ParB/RepB/Spo0J family partition protein
MKLKLKDILPNPFRDLKANPLIEEKIVELVDSINLTGFWDNVVVRKNKDDKYELAYGHHRLAAAIRAGLIEADFIVKVLSDGAMIQIMDNENRDTYASSPASMIESVRAVVKALAAGTIPAFAIDEKTNTQHIRFAPSFMPGTVSSPSGGEHPYTAVCISQFLGRARKGGKEASPAVVAALDALYLKERGRFNDSLLTTKDKTGAKVPITNNELLRITRDIKQEVERVDKRTTAAKQTAAEFDKQQRAIQKELKEVAEKADAARKRLVTELAKAKVEENKPKVAEIKEKIAEKEQYAVEKKLDLEVRAAELDKKVEKRKEQEAAAKKEDAYLPTKREVERILHKLEGETATTKEALVAEIKSLARQPLNNMDRERLRQAALNYGTWYCEWASQQFLPPLSNSKKLNEYRSREATNRRAAEAKAERDREKAERKAAKEKKVAQPKK